MGHAKVLRGWAEITEFMRVPFRTLKHWNEDYGLPLIKIPGTPQVFAVDQDLLRWLRIWRVRDYLKREGSIRKPPELKEIKKGLGADRRRSAYHQQKKKKTGNP